MNNKNKFGMPGSYLRWLLLCFFLLYAFFLVWHNFSRFHRGANIHDLYIFESSFWNTLHGRFFWNFYEFGNHLGVHFSPGLFFLVPFYAVVRNPLCLLFLQSMAFVLAGWPLYVLARRILGDEWSAFFILLGFWCYAPTLGAAFSGFHEAPFVLPFLFGLFWALEAKRNRLFWFFAFGALLWKETYSIMLFFLGLYMLAAPGTRKRGFHLLLLSFLWGIWTFCILMPLIRGTPVSQGLIRYRFPEEIGHSWGEIAGNFLKNPLFFFRYAFQRPNLYYLVRVFAPLLFLPLLSPGLVLPVLPQLAQNLLSRHLFGVSLMKHYTAAVIPFLFYAALRSLSTVSAFLERKGKNRVLAIRLLSGLLFAACFLLTVQSGIYRKISLRERTKEETWHYLSPVELAEARQLGATVPREASFAVSGHLAKYFAGRKVISYISPGFLRIFPFDYLLYYAPLPNGDIFKNNPDLDKMLDEQYELVERRDRLFLYRRRNLPVSPEQKQLIESVPR